MRKNVINAKDNVKIHYEVAAGKNGKHPLVLLHGLGGNIRSWDEERKILKELGYTTVAIDLRGHGFSGRPHGESSYELIKFVEDIRCVLENEKISTCILIGHCLGGMIALYTQALYPHTAKALILIDTGFYAPYIGKHSVTKVLVKKMFHVLGRYAPKLHFSGHVPAAKYKGTSEYDIPRMLSDITHVSLHSYFLTCAQITAFNGSYLLKKIQIPTLIIQGEKDTVFPPRMAEALQSRIKNSTIEFVPDATHILVINNPISVAVSIERFLINCKL